MAYTKQNNEENSFEDVLGVAKDVESTASPKKSTPKSQGDSRIDELEAQNKRLQEQLDSLLKMVAGMTTTSTQPVKTNEKVNSLLDEVKIVHLVQRAGGLTTTIHLSNLDITMSEFGEERTIDRRQAEELVGGHRRLFERGTIAFGDGNEELAKRLSVKSVSQYSYMSRDFLQRLATMSARELEDLYAKLCEGHKAFIIEYFKRKIIEKDPAFMDVGKIDVLNRLSDRAMSDVLLDKDRATGAR